MVHALREAWRVLKPEGLLIDLRPALEHRRIGIAIGRRYRLLGVMQESFLEDRAANRAVAQVERDGLFALRSRRKFPCERVMESLEDFREWVAECRATRAARGHRWLIDRVARALARGGPRARIVARAPVVLSVFEKRAGAVE